MEEEPQSAQINGQEGGDEFYEEIEAPKFVDFTTPDHYRPDDRYWFCMRVGCDRKHEEELDPEAVYKDFVLRVMAARSPNVRRRKAPSLKCPLTAPAKSSKSRVSRLALISSVSHKLVDAKDKARPVHKISATPNVKAKKPSAVAKALTTPRNRNPISNPDTFRSVRNPKPKNLLVPKNRVVAKSLVFHSPKKAVRTKVSVEIGNPVRKLCAAMKKLDITNGKKQHVLGYNKPLPLDTSRKQFRGREVKSRVFDSLHSHNRKGQEAKSVKRKNKEKDLKQCCDPVPHEGVDNDSSYMEVDEKSRKGSVKGFSTSVTPKSGEVNADEELLGTAKISELPLGENQVEVLSETSKGGNTSLSSSEERDSEENDDKENANDGNGHDERKKSSSEMGNTHEGMESDDNKENALASYNTENENENIESDDKENNMISDDNREQNFNGHSKRTNLGKHDASKNSQKVNQADKVLKENSTPAATNAHGVKYRKPKPTNPKPFRFRTDERGMLKEANSEKKVHAPLKEITLVRLPGAKSIKKNHNVIETKKNCVVQSEPENDNHGNCEKRLDRKTRLDQNGRVGATCFETSKGDFEQKLSVMTSQRSNVSTCQKASLVTSQNEHGQGRVQKSEKERNKSPMVQQKIVILRGVDSSRKKAMVSSKTPVKLSVIKETSTTKIRSKKATKPCGASSTTKASACTPPRSLSRGRRPATIPKEPHFHSIHVPKSCTRLHKENDLVQAQ